jgi:hypothetical protein
MKMILKFLTMGWSYQGRPITEISDMPEGTIGFIYKIINHQTGEYYIGKKSLYAKRTLPPLKGYKRKRKVIKESKWVDYRSSNTAVQLWFHEHEAAIETGNQDKINDSLELKILRFCKTPKSLTYYEVEELFQNKVLQDELSLNDNILGKFFRKDLDI